MSPKTGRPKSANPKDIKLQIRVDAETLQDIDECAKRKNSNRSEIVREGVKLVKAGLKE